MAFNITSVLDSMLTAVRPALEGFGKVWATIASRTRKTLRLLAEQFVFAARGLAAGELTLLEAKEIVASATLLVIANTAAAVVIVKAQAQRAIDAAIGAVKDAVNAAAGLALL